MQSKQETAADVGTINVCRRISRVNLRLAAGSSETLKSILTCVMQLQREKNTPFGIDSIEANQHHARMVKITLERLH